ncbi:MAG: hypothetical protein ACOX9C_04310 [Kiritimatiellia bacterium]|jgi:hypothetical protein
MKHLKTIVAISAAAVLLGGCASILDRIGEEDIARLDELAWKWVERLEEKYGRQDEPAPEAPEAPQAEAPSAGTPADPAPTAPDAPAAAALDQAEFAALQWRYGGFDGSRARLDSPRLSNLRADGSRLWYKWDVGLSGWGLGHGDAGAVCAVFFLKDDGAWVGGKFDWVSTSRSDRELKHVESYSNWPSSGIRLPWRGKVAFVVVSADGRRRSNVLVAEGGK